MKHLFLITSVLLSFNILAQGKWDLGLKLERNDKTGLQLETRYHINEHFALTAQICGGLDRASNFGLYGFDETDSVYYYQNNESRSKSAKLNLGAQYFLPFKRKIVYVGVGFGLGYDYNLTNYSFFTGLTNTENSLTDPGQSYGYSILMAPPKDGQRKSESMFTSSELTIGLDLPLKERLIFTSSVSSGFQFQRNFIRLNYSVAVGLRYRFIKQS